MRAVVTLALVLLAAGCALIPGRDLEPGKSTRADVVAEMGAPDLSLDGGRLLYFTRWPWGRVTYVAAIGPDGVLRAFEQRLTYANIHAARVGMTPDEVRRLLGPPYRISRLPRQKREVWEYPWLHAAHEGRVLYVQFADDGLAKEVFDMHDYERDPENDSRR
jgi:hypothetical protein